MRGVGAGDMPFMSGWPCPLASGFFNCCSSTSSSSSTTFLFSASPQVGIAGRESSLSSFFMSKLANCAYCGGSATFVAAGRDGGMAPADMAGSER